jgi:RsiW-degrading membrane proteinase PrsW (M82 family)
MGMFFAAVAFFIFEDLENIRVYEPLVAMRGAEAEQGVFFFLVAAPVEEVLKLASATLILYLSPQGLSLRDAPVLVTASAAGFSACENFYAMWSGQGPDAGRAMVVPFMHILFSSFSGYGLAMSRQRRSAMYLGLLLAIAYHGLYNFLEFRAGLWHFLLLPLVLLMYLFMMRSLKQAV